MRVKQSILLEIAHLNAMIGNEDRFIASLEKQMLLLSGANPLQRKVFFPSKGLGVVTVAGLIGEVGDFKKFDTHAEIMKLAGFDLFEVSSGQHRGQRHISKAWPRADEKSCCFLRPSIPSEPRGLCVHATSKCWTGASPK